MLEHARAAEAAGAHRFCMVAQGQGLSKRDFEKVLAGARLVAEHTNLKRCASIGHISAERAQGAARGGHPARPPQRRVGRELLPRGLRDGPLRGAACGRSRRSARRASRPASAASSTSARRREQRVEMAFELAAINPTSVPINLLIPRAGTKFGERELMDPWEAVKWVAIFRLILPEALFRLCGGRIENLGELGAARRARRAQRRDDGQLPDRARRDPGGGPRDVRAARPEHRAPARQRRATRAPTTARGWLDGRDPRRRRAATSTTTPSSAPPLGPLDAAALPPASARERARRRERSRARASRSCATAACTAARGWSAGRRARACCSTASRCCCCARTTTSASPSTRACARRRRMRRCAGASARARRAWCRGR